MPFVLRQTQAPFHYLRTKSNWRINTTPNLTDAHVYRRKNHVSVVFNNLNTRREADLRSTYKTRNTGYEIPYEVVPVSVIISDVLDAAINNLEVEPEHFETLREILHNHNEYINATGDQSTLSNILMERMEFIES